MRDSSPSIARTFSQPISYASQEEHCYRALTSCYSFGRYESDLDWGKWSCFSQNRCLEEVQKLSKPGTVAAMKAYFEARYKRFACNKKSGAVLPNHQDEVPRDSHDPCVRKIHNNSQTASEFAKFEANNTRNDVKEGEVNTEQYGFVENSTDLGSSKKHGNGQKYNTLRFTKEMRTLSKNNADLRDLTPSSTRKPAISSSKASMYGSASKLQAPATLENNSTPNSNKTARDSLVKRRSQLESFHKSLSSDTCASESKKTSSPILDSIRNLRIIKSFGKSPKDSTTKQAPTRERLHGVATCDIANPHEECISCAESSSAGRKKSSSAVFSSFNFEHKVGAIHEEKLEKKLNTKATEKAQMQTKSKPYSSKLGRTLPPRQGQDSASSPPRSGSSGKTHIKVCYRQE
ncbi:hypothetical protein POM88_033565 [Heracleum sosnowskyi]|uniref:Uncharacterized protein n=1 Tax=Heracleum sosnowskyi TaxID=360622 RepID=A0AAD8MLN5_9APIA|nr:hypothetical protein POM88_033565 [Heracleum sosnowskyi]